MQSESTLYLVPTPCEEDVVAVAVVVVFFTLLVGFV
jgi:hypothetical protein